MKQAFESVKKLVEDFRAHERDYLSPTYQESHVRQDFIDKFFTALGWDVTHERQKNPHEYEVQIENRIQIGAAQQRADYAFFLAPNFRDPKFYVEAKKPARQLKNPDFFYQTMRYGWNGNTPIAILTDFEEFYVIDCRLKPNIKDALSREIKSFRYTDYANEEKFAWIYWLFSHEAVASGSIEKHASALRRPKGKAAVGIGKVQPVDEAFLAELDGYRESLAKGFKKSNQDLDGEELTEAVQRTIDRLVFIRFLEDKLIEEKEIANLIDRQLAWELFVRYCKRLEPKYNGLIFKPHRIDNKDFKPPDEQVFKEICEGLAGRESPYNFAQIPISILGSIYERFLGKVVHATDKRVKVEEKPEVRKAGGVYYTPDYIVRYIVKETVGKLIDGKTPEEISKMAFADIACGSGSFLIEVYDLLLKYHERYYAEHPDKAKKADLENREGRKVLSLKKRQEILVNNIYGVDIDYQATEVTQLSLYLKLLEDVTTNDAYQFSLLKEKILPNLSKNIVCGNSLIGTDSVDGDLFFSSSSHAELVSASGKGIDADIHRHDSAWVARLKPMNFEDAFPEVMKHGGFDAVVGNPPYGYMISEEQQRYFSKHYKFQDYQKDLYLLFLERYGDVIKENGFLGVIVSNTWLQSITLRKIRQYLASHFLWQRILTLPEKVFKAIVDTDVLVFKKTKNIDVIDHQVFVDTRSGETIKLINTIPWKSVPKDGQPINVFASNVARDIINKIEGRSMRLSEVHNVFNGVKPFEEGKGDPPQTKEIVKEKPYVKDGKRPKNTWSPLLRGSLIERYHNRWDKNYWILYGPWLAAPRDDKIFEAPLKIVVRQTGDSIIATLCEAGFIARNNLHLILPGKGKNNLKYILGTMNSKLMDFYYTFINPEKGEALAEVKKEHVESLPIHMIDFSDPADKVRHDHIVNLVERMLAAKEELSKAKTEAETTRLERECETLDRQIDQAVYELYGLTEEEIKIVENV